MGIVIRQSLKAGVGSYLGVAIGIVNQMYVSTKFLSVEQLALSRLLFENSLFFAAFAHLGTPFIADKFFGLFRNDKEHHQGILTFILGLPLLGGILFSLIYFLCSDLIREYYQAESPMLLKYHFLVVPLTFFWMYITVLESYTRNNSRIAIPNFIREVYLRMANMLLVLFFGLGWLSFDVMIYLVIASYGVGVVFMIFYIKQLGKWYWKWPNRSILTNDVFKNMLAYGSFTLLGGVGVNLMLFIDRSMLAGERGLFQTGIFIIAAYIAGIIEIPRKAIAQISIPILSDSLSRDDRAQVRTMNQKSALNQFIAGGLIFLLIWCGIDEIFYLLPKGDTYSEGKYVVFYLALVKVLDIGTGLNLEIILYSKYYRFATLLIIISAIIGFSLNVWLIPLYGYTGAAISTALTALVYAGSRMYFVWLKFGVLPYTDKTLKVFFALLSIYLLSLLLPDYQFTFVSTALVLVVRSAAIVLVFGWAVIRFNLSEEITQLATTLRKRVFDNR